MERFTGETAARDPRADRVSNVCRPTGRLLSSKQITLTGSASSAACCALATLLHALPVRAGNEEGVLFGAAAGMSAGAVTATTDDGCALWYNPAGLVGADTRQLDVSGTAYVFRHFRAPDLLRVPAAPSVPGEVTELMSVSASLTFARRLSDRVTLGFGLFTPRAADQTFRATAQAPGDVRWLVANTTVASEYDAGVGVGWSPHPRLRLGASLFVAYESLSGASIVQATRGAGPAPEEFSNASELFSYKRAGVELSFGAQWRPIDGLRVGLTVRPPGFNVYAAETTDRAASFATREGAALRSGAEGASTDTSSFEFTQRTPLRVRLGVAWERPRVTVSLDGDLAAPFTPDDPDDRAWSLHWNLRLGAVWRVSDRLRAGAGVFTDRDPGRGAAQRPVDFYGGTVGVEWGTLHLLRDAQRDRLTFSTSLSARYAYGQGEVDAVVVDPNAVRATSTTSTLDVHEVAVYLGSSFRF